MTHRQKEFYDFIRLFWQKYGHSPSYREISAHFHVNKGFSHKTIKRLEEQGWLRVVRNHKRGIVPFIQEARGET